MRKNLRVFLLFFLTFLGSSLPNAEAINYFVDNAAGLDSNSGISSALPWKTIVKINSSILQPGDTINFKGNSVWSGTSLMIASSGVSGKPVVYQSYGGGRRPEIIAPTTPWANSIKVTGNWNIVKGFLLDGGHEAGIRTEIGATNNRIENNEIHTTGIGVMFLDSNNIAINNYVHDLRMIVNDATPNNDYGAECFWTYAPNNEFSYNRGVNCKAASMDFGTDGGFLEIYNFGDNTKVHHNMAINTNGFVETGSTVGGHANNVQIYHNVINNSGGLCLNAGGYNISLSGWKFENNTVYSQNGNSVVINRILGCRSDLSSLSVKNNIFFSDTQIASSAPAVHTNNIYNMVNMMSGSGIGYSTGLGELSGNPQFVLSGTDFHLSAGSPAIDAGINLGYTKDFEGSAVPVGTPDLGAYESSIAISPDITLPVISFTAPLGGARVNGSIPVTVSASDNVGVVGVQFKLDGNNLSPEVMTVPYSIFWNTAASTNGVHVLSATARDAAGNTGNALNVSVTIVTGMIVPRNFMILLALR